MEYSPAGIMDMSNNIIYDIDDIIHNTPCLFMGYYATMLPDELNKSTMYDRMIITDRRMITTSINSPIIEIYQVLAHLEHPLVRNPSSSGSEYASALDLFCSGGKTSKIYDSLVIKEGRVVLLDDTHTSVLSIDKYHEGMYSLDRLSKQKDVNLFCFDTRMIEVFDVPPYVDRHFSQYLSFKLKQYLLPYSTKIDNVHIIKRLGEYDFVAYIT